MKLASTIEGDWNHGVTIDGIEFPFYVAEDGFEVEPGGSDGMTVVRLGVLVSGVVILRDRHGDRRVYDPVEGDVAAWARRLVRAGLLERIPDLILEGA